MGVAGITRRRFVVGYFGVLLAETILDRGKSILLYRVSRPPSADRVSFSHGFFGPKLVEPDCPYDGGHFPVAPTRLFLLSPARCPQAFRNPLRPTISGSSPSGIEDNDQLCRL